MVETKELQLAQPIDTGNVILIIVYLVAIIVAAYFLTKFIAKRSLRRGMKEEPRHSKRGAFSQFGRKRTDPGHMVNVVDRIAVDRDKTLMVVEFQGNYYLIGTTSDGFERIDRVKMPSFHSEPEEPAASVDEMPAGEPTEPQSAATPDGTSSGPGSGEPPAADESSFSDRFKKAFGIVLRSYLPKGARGRSEMSFDEQLQARIKADSDKTGKKSG